jgi:hypothetical protein
MDHQIIGSYAYGRPQEALAMQRIRQPQRIGPIIQRRLG